MHLISSRAKTLRCDPGPDHTASPLRRATAKTILLAVALAVALASAGSASTSTAWSTPTHVAKNIRGPNQVAVSANGDMLIAWQSSKGCLSVRLLSSGHLSAVQTITCTAIFFHIAISPTGDAAISWAGTRSKYGYFVRARARGGHLGPLQQVQSTGNPLQALFDLAVQQNGQIVVLSANGDQVLRQDVQPNGTLSSPTAVTTAAFPPDHILSDSHGNLLITAVLTTCRGPHYAAESREGQSRARTAQTCTGVLWAQQLRGGALGPPIQVSPGTSLVWDVVFLDHTTEPVEGEPYEMAIAPNGDAVFTWEQLSASATELWGRALSASGTVGAVEKISSTAYARIPYVPGPVSLVAMNSGRSLVSWAWGSRSGAFAVRTVTATSLGPVRMIASQRTPFTFAWMNGQIVPSGGAAVAVWSTATCEDATGPCTAAARSVSASGALGAVQPISAHGLGSHLWLPTAIAASSGRVTAFLLGKGGLWMTAGRVH